MSIFNSLGSNYNFNYVLESLLSNGNLKEKELRRFLEEKYNGKSILTYKGREALTAALKILDLPKDSLVAINGFTCVAVYNAIEIAGYKPLCLDLEKDNSDLNFSPRALEKAIRENEKLKVVVVQNTLGYPADIEDIKEICSKKKIIIIEDLAHCVGTQYLNGIEAGTIGDMTTLSFSQDKVIDAVSGGALVIRNKKYFRTLSEFNESKGNFKQPKNQFKDKLYPLLTYKIRNTYGLGIGKPMHFILKKLNLLSNPMQDGLYDFYSLSDWHCNLILKEFRNLVKKQNHRQKIAQIYADNLDKKITHKNIVDKIIYSSNLRFPIFLNDRKELIQKLKENKIFVSDIWYDDVDPGSKNAVEISNHILNLPTHINVSENDAQKICKLVNSFI